LANNKRYCTKDKPKSTQYLYKTGRALDCPTDYVQDPKDMKRCVYGKYLKQVLCKRGHRVDQIKFINFKGDQTLSHSGFAGGGWRRPTDRQTVNLASDEYVKRVDSWHITRGYARNQLSKIVYFTSKDRIVSCYYNRVRYSTNRY